MKRWSSGTEAVPATIDAYCPVEPEEPLLLPEAGAAGALPEAGADEPAAGAAVLLEPAAGAAVLLAGAAGAVLAGGVAAGAAVSEEGCLAQAVINSIEAASALRATFVFIDGTPME